MKHFKIAGGLLLGFVLAGCAMDPRHTHRDPYDPSCQLGREPVTVPLINWRNYQWQVDAIVDGVPGVFILDTGADYTVVTPEFARRTGLWEDSTEGRLISRDAPPGRVRFARVTDLWLGDVDYGTFYVPIIDLSHIQQAMAGEIDGILGNNVLNKTAWQIDGPRNRLKLSARSSAPPPGFIPIAVRQNHVYLKVLINGHQTGFALDTGAYRSTLSGKELSRLKIPPEKRRTIDAPRIDINRAQQLRQTEVQLDRFEVGPLVRTNYPMIIWDHNVLGMDLLARRVLTVDARQGWLTLTDPIPQAGP